jgi:hypothetical protein
MQAIAPATDHNPNDHTEDEVLAALEGHSGTRRWSFRYELLNSGNTILEEELDNVLDATVSQNWLADIKRTATFSFTERGGIDYLSDRLRPWVRLHLPPYGALDWVEWPQGVFLLSTTERQASMAGTLTREVTGYDQLQVYSDDLLAARYAVASGTVVTTAVQAVLSGVLSPPVVNVVPHASTLPATKEWEPGTSKLRVINDLLGMINYESLSFDENGVAQVQPYRAPSERPAEYEYLDDHHGLVVPELGQELDLFSVPNHWVLVVSEPDQAPLVGTYTNSDPASPTSTIRRQRTITDYRTEVEAVDQATLDAKASRLAFEASQVYEAIPFRTGLMPIHSGNDVYRLRLQRLAVNARYAEASWKLPLKAGAHMDHVARRVVTV